MRLNALALLLTLGPIVGVALAIAAVVVLLMWFLFSVQAILLGAEVNAAPERRARYPRAGSQQQAA